MLRVYGCITEQHDLWLVALAGIICLFACFTTASLLNRVGVAERQHGLAWLTALLDDYIHRYTGQMAAI